MHTLSPSPATDGNANAHSPVDARLERLRAQMRSAQIDAVIVPSSDPHLSEYLPARWQARQWLSGFTGSAGTLLVTREHAALFVDSRYWTQADRELAGCAIRAEKVTSITPTVLADWLLERVPEGGSVAVDGAVLAVQAKVALCGLISAGGLRLQSGVDLPGLVWDDRPALPSQPVYEHLAPHATRSRRAKLAEVREAMARAKADRHLVSTLDDIAWLLNLRGSDVAYNPVFLAHLLVAPGQAWLFVDTAKLPAALGLRLSDDGVVLRPYEVLPQELEALCGGCTVLIDPARVTQGLKDALPASCRTVEAINPSTLLKSRKTEAELEHVREAMIEDGAAMCAFYAWFEQALVKGSLSELDVDERLSAERARRRNFVGLSFPTIAGYNANGAMPHYRATPGHFARIEGNGLLLIDSGAQYLGGTTDITRVWRIGTPSRAMQRDFTLVLKGTMALSQTRFPRGTLAPMLDAIARAPLWAEGLDFGHGTGHGVGYFLNVHEGPQSISRALPTAHMAMEPGMITSIEPGVYRPGLWGVRIENLVANRSLASEPQWGSTDVFAEARLAEASASGSAQAGGFGEFLEFETLSLCPIDTRCIDTSLLREDEKRWLNDYHRRVCDQLMPRVQGAASDWLRARTQPL